MQREGRGGKNWAVVWYWETKNFETPQSKSSRKSVFSWSKIFTFHLTASHAAAEVMFKLFLKLHCATTSFTDHTGSLVPDFRHSGRKHYNINGGCVWCESTSWLTVPPPVVMVVCPPNVLPTKRGFHPGRRGKSSQLFFFFNLLLSIL